MSKERYLLMRAKVLLECVDTAPLQDQADLIIKEIEELLAQPEPTAEPVAWMWDEMFCDDWTTVSSVIKPSKSKYVDNVRPLYLAPPKRTPLSNEEIDKGLNGKNGFENWYDDRFVDGVDFAEKHHGIGGGE